MLVWFEKEYNNNFMIQENDGGFRIQSHYIGRGLSIDNLEKKVNKILEKIFKLRLDLIREEKLKQLLN